MTKSKASAILLTMNSYTVTISSKNQLTLPAKLVRELKLGKGQKLELRQKSGKVELVPKPSLKESLSGLHAEVAKEMKSRGVKAPTDEELNDSLRKIAAKRAR